jgi:protoporphyrinogen oxidase
MAAVRPLTEGSALRVAIIGGGLGGLVAADRLLAAGLEVTIFEKYPEAGGLVGTFAVGGTPLERFYHHLFTSDVDYVDFARELGLDKDIEWLPSKMGFYTSGKLYDFGTPASLLKFSPLGPLGKLVFVLSTLRLRQRKDWKDLEGETAAGWLRKHGYGKAYDAVWGPLLHQKYGRRAEEIGLVWLWGKIALRSRSRDESGLGERVGYMKGSFGRGIDAILKKVKERGGEVRTARPVKVVARAEGGLAVEYAGGRDVFDRVLSTVAIPELLRLAPDLPAEAREKWGRISYCHALCPVLELKEPFSPYYWLNIGDVSMPFGGLIEQTNFLPPSLYGGRHVLYVSNYVLPDDPRWRMRDEELWPIYYEGLKRVNPRSTADGDPGSPAAPPAAEAASPEPVAFTKEVPPAPGGKVEYAAVFDAAGIDAEEQARLTKARDLLAALPEGTDPAVKKQIVEASLKAFGVPIDKIIEAGVAEIQALEGYIRAGASDTAKVLEESNQRIAQYEEEIRRIRTVMDERTKEQLGVTSACNQKKLEVQRVLEFFGQEAVAKVVRESPKLVEPGA